MFADCCIKCQGIICCCNFDPVHDTFIVNSVGCLHSYNAIVADGSNFLVAIFDGEFIYYNNFGQIFADKSMIKLGAELKQIIGANEYADVIARNKNKLMEAIERLIQPPKICPYYMDYQIIKEQK